MFRTRSRTKTFLSLLVVVASIFASGYTPAQAHRDGEHGQPFPTQCARAFHASGPHVRITTPRSGASIDLARTPTFTVAGLAWAGWQDPIRRVEIYADGSRIGDASVAVPLQHSDDRDWRIVTSAPPGTHTIVACAWSVAGRTAAAAIIVKVTAPAPTSTVVAPDVRTLTSVDLAAISGVTDTKITFRQHPSVSAGQVLVAGISTATPDGLIRRVTRIDRTRAGYVASTIPASVDEVLWQADIHLVGVPLEPESGDGVAAPRVALGGKSAARALAAAPAVAAAVDEHYQVHVGGSGSLQADIETGISAGVDFDLKITADWGWDTVPTITVEQFRMRAHAAMNVSTRVHSTGEGSADYTSPILRSFKFNRIRLHPVLPIYLRIRGDLRMGAGLKLSGALALGGFAHGSVDLGVELRNGQLVPIAGSSLGGGIGVPPKGEKRSRATCGSSRRRTSIRRSTCCACPT